MNTIHLKAYAKINLGLDIVRKREDGYHEVKMIMQTIGLYDKLVIHKTNNPNITLKTNLPYLPEDMNNLVYKAAILMKERYEIKEGMHIRLEKKIPVSAGLAGGSTDAAAALSGINQLFRLNLRQETLMAIGLELGADIPYCIMQGTALSEGIGEILTPLPPFPSCHVLIVKPNINVSTKYVYEHLKLDKDTFHPNIDGIIEHIKANNLQGATSLFSNVLETVTIKEYPIINRIKEQMLSQGAMVSLMSGSGPTVFGLFEDNKAAENAFYQFKVGEFGKQTYLTRIFHPIGKVSS